MSSQIEDISINFEENGVLLQKELDKKILSKGAWATVMFYYQDYDKASESYKEPKISIQRYQKRDGEYIQRSKFNISSKKQATMIASKIKSWYELTNDEIDSGEVGK